MTRKSVPRQKRDDRLQPGGQQVASADGVRAKLLDRRRRHHQHGNGGRQFGLTGMLAVAGVVAVLSVASYFWYVAVIRDIVRTPLQTQRFGDAAPPSQQDMERFWGSYRSGHYFGMKTCSPRSPVVGKKKCIRDIEMYRGHFSHCYFASFCVIFFPVVHVYNVISSFAMLSK